MDVKIAFLNGDLNEEIYMEQPEGFVLPGNERKLCTLVKFLHGLKQAPKQWHEKFDGQFLLMVSLAIMLTSAFILSLQRLME